MTKRALDRIPRDRANSCPELIVQLNKEGDETVDRSSRYYTAKHYIHSTVSYNQKNQETQTKFVSDRDTRIHYTSSLEDSDSDTSECDENIEGTENITVTKRYLKSRSLSSEDLYTAPVQPYKRFCTSTPEPYERKPEKEPFHCPLKEIINHEGALKVPPVDIIAAPGQRGANAQRGLQRVQAMAGRGRQQNPAPNQVPNLQGADRPLYKSCN